MLVSPIPVAKLRAYFGVGEEELLVLKARAEVAIHEWVLVPNGQGAPSPKRPRTIRRRRSPKSRPSDRVPEWKRLRPRAGRVWEPEEDAALLREFDADLPLEEIAARRGRGVFSVEVRLCKLGFGHLLPQRERA